MTILAVDTAGPICSACIFDENSQHVIAERSENIGRGHAEHLPILTGDVLTQAGLGFDKLTKLAVTEGPGSFAGIRVGISFIRTLKLALKIPAIGVGSLQALALEAHRDGQHTLSILDARRDQFYIFGSDGGGQPLIAPSAIQTDQIGEILEQNNWVLCGDGAQKALEQDKALQSKFDIAHQKTSPSIEFVAKIASQTMHEDVLPIPLYLREADAKVQTNFALDRQ